MKESPGRSPSAKQTLALEYLAGNQKNGLWPYFPGKDGSIEASAFAAIACRNINNCHDNFLNAMLALQNKDGGWSNDSLRLESDWSTYIGLFALSFLQIENKTKKKNFPWQKISESCNKAELWLLDNRSEYYSSAAKFALLIWKGPEHDYERGWPWTQETFDWVEPTSYALLSLKLSQNADTVRISRIRSLAESYLLNLVCSSGGWNFGDRNPYSRETPADTQSTALALLALKDRGSHAKVKESLRFIENRATKADSLNELAWCSLVLATYASKIDSLVTKLEDSIDENGRLSDNLMTQAIACLSFQLLTQEGKANALRSLIPRGQS